MKQVLLLFSLGLLVTGCKSDQKNSTKNNGEVTAKTEEQKDTGMDSTAIEISPISHATAVISWGDAVFYTDPVGGAAAFKDTPKPNFILITDIHGDHLNAETLEGLKLDSTKIVVPQAVKEKLPKEFYQQLVVMNNGDTQELDGFEITAIPMYNLPEDPDSFHTKGRGNGYVLEKNDRRLYISGDTEDIPEMRQLEDIDVALVCMNLPYTMSVEQAAEGVLAFAPKKVYPYHYRGKDGKSDIDQFKKLVNNGNKNIKVELLNWYPEDNKEKM